MGIKNTLQQEINPNDEKSANKENKCLLPKNIFFHQGKCFVNFIAVDIKKCSKVAFPGRLIGFKDHGRSSKTMIFGYDSDFWVA